MVQDILNQALNIARNLALKRPVVNNDKHKIRLVVLSGTNYEQEFSRFVSRINEVLNQYKIGIDLVKTNYLSIGRLLFNNCDQKPILEICERDCFICSNHLKTNQGSVTSIVTKVSYKVDGKLTCKDGGIYVLGTPCREQYTGKTTNKFACRTKEHLVSRDTAVSTHRIM